MFCYTHTYRNSVRMELEMFCSAHKYYYTHAGGFGCELCDYFCLFLYFRFYVSKRRNDSKMQMTIW